VDTFFKALETQAPDTVPLASSARVTTNGRVGTLAEAFESFSPETRLSIREADQDSYYGLIAAAEACWRAFHTSVTSSA